MAGFASELEALKGLQGTLTQGFSCTLNGGRFLPPHTPLHLLLFEDSLLGCSCACSVSLVVGGVAVGVVVGVGGGR